MTAAVMLMICAFSVSLVLALVQFLMWRTLGRQRHALYWTLALGGWALLMAINVAVASYSGDGLVGNGYLEGLAMMTSILAAVGHRARVGLAPQWRWFIAPWALATLGVFTFGAVAPETHLHIAITPLFASVVLFLGAKAISIPQRPLRPIERIALATTIAFAAFEAVLGASTLVAAATGNALPLGSFLVVLHVGVLGFLTAAGLLALSLQWSDLTERLDRLAEIDPLTLLLNRRGLEATARRAIDQARLTRQPVSAIIADLDGFQQVNARFGRRSGDAVLTRFAEFIQETVGERALASRSGGQEFVILLPGFDVQWAKAIAERLCAGCSKIAFAGLPDLQLTSSFGVTAMEAADVDLGDVLRRADAALYEAKAVGGNRVAVASEVVSDRSARRERREPLVVAR